MSNDARSAFADVLRSTRNGGSPVRASFLPYGRQSVDEADIQAVVEVLRSDWLTTGPKVGEFEEAFAARVGAAHAVSFQFRHCRLACGGVCGWTQARRRSDHHSHDVRRDRELRFVSGRDSGVCGCQRRHAESRSRTDRRRKSLRGRRRFSRSTTRGIRRS